MAKLVTVALLGLSLLMPAANADEAQAETCLRTKVWDGYADGWGIRTMTSTMLDSGATRNYLVTLYKGNEYQIQTCGDKHVTNLDVLLYDLDGNVVLRDDTTDREPKLDYKPESTGTFYIVMHARDLTKETAGVAMAVTYR
ncbi:MAG: hypothetical protein HN348_23175 [Proteobacteria bacterium]|nr:hypothetical protein [Pseudomonadota bacterium]